MLHPGHHHPASGGCRLCEQCRLASAAAPFHWCVEDRVVPEPPFRGPSPWGAPGDAPGQQQMLLQLQLLQQQQAAAVAAGGVWRGA